MNNSTSKTFQDNFNKIVRDYMDKAFDETQKVLETAANDVKNTMQAATTNVKTGKFKRGWKVKKYPNSKYVYNGPLTNIIEFSKKGPKPFIQNTWNRIEGDTKRKILNGLRQKLK